MTAPSNLPDLPPHLRHFTDREQALAAYNSLWPGDGPWLLAFHGLSGNGKSTLIDFLIETRCKPAGLTWAVLDFEGSRGRTLRTNQQALLDALAGQWQLLNHPAYTTGRDSALRQYELVRRSVQVKLEQKAGQGGRISGGQSRSDALRRNEYRDALRPVGPGGV